MNIVGTPYRAVHFSFCTEARTSRGSKLSTITAMAPCVTIAITPSTRPKQWNRGTGRQTRSSAENFCRSPMAKPLLRMLQWVSITPLGKPVVPEVYCMLITSSEARPAAAFARGPSGACAPSRRSSGVVYMPRCFSGPMKITDRSLGNRAEASVPLSQSFSSGMSSFTMAT